MSRATGLGLLAYGRYPELSGVRRVLVIMLRHLGDTLLSGPVFTTLKEDLGAEVDAMVYRSCAGVLAGHPDVHAIHALDAGWRQLPLLARWRAELGLIGAIRARRYDLVINLTEGDRGAIAAWLSGAGLRVGIAHPHGFAGKRSLYTHVADRCPTPRHTVERHLDVLRSIGLFASPAQRRMKLAVPADAQQKMQALLAARGLDAAKLIVVHPASRWRFKCWPMERVASAVRELLAQGWSVAMTTSPDPVELAMAAEIARQAAHPRLANLGGGTGVAELAALLHSARALLTVDSLPLHMASALGTPTVALFGPTREANWGPWMNPRARVVALDHYPCRPCGQAGCANSKVSDCLVQLPESRVMAALHEVLAPH